MSLLSLPLSLLEDIIVFTLGLPAPVFSTQPNIRTIYINSWPPRASPEFLRDLLSVCRASRQLHTVAARLFYSRSLFDFTGLLDNFDSFVNAIGPVNQSNLRYVAVSIEKVSPREETRATLACVHTLSRLPASLRGLWVDFPIDGTSSVAITGADPLLVTALQRFHDLRILVIQTSPHHFPWDLLAPREPGPEPASPFPLLEELHLQGLLWPRIAALDPGAVFSQANLPSLRHLIFRGVENNVALEPKMPRTESLASLLTTAPPLQSFYWARSDSDSAGHLRPLAPQFLADIHFRTLVARHGETLQELHVDMARHGSFAWAVTEEAVSSVLVSLPALREATILAPTLDFIAFLQAIEPQAQGTISPSLETLILTLGSEHEPLQLALDNGSLSSLCGSTKLGEIRDLKLKLVIGQRPDGLSNVQRGNTKQYPKLRRALASCLWPQEELAVAVRSVYLVDLHGYGPFKWDLCDDWDEGEGAYAEDSADNAGEI